MENNREGCYRPWGELIPDALALIFKKTSFQENLTVVPAVCKSRRTVVLQPDCWQEIDIEEWCHRSKPEIVERMVEILVNRSQRSMRKLCLFRLASDKIFAFVASHSNNLETLRMPASQVTDSIVTKVAPKLANITYLDITCCKKMASFSLESLGKHCKFLIHLRWYIHPFSTIGKDPNDDEAFAIANNMPHLKHLELGYGLLTDAGMEVLLRMCEELEHLNIRGCWNVDMKNSVSDGCSRLKVFVGRVGEGLDWYKKKECISIDDQYDSLSDDDRDYSPMDYEE